MQLNIPSDLRGASLAKAHTWVKSNMAVSNPGGSADYKLTDVRGNPVSLSDIVTNSELDEVVVISGVRTNPHHTDTTMTSYPTSSRIGNSIHKILGVEDIDSALVYQMYAQEGLFAATQSLTIMGLQDAEIESLHFSPQKAALIQAYSMANVKTNPADGAPFTQSSLERKSAYNSEKVIQDFLRGAFNIDITDLSKADFEDEIYGAKVSAKYKLNSQDIKTFANDVLAPYLVAAGANREALKMINQYYREEIKDKSTMSKIVGVLPTRSEQYYEGVEDAIVAHPVFLYSMTHKRKVLSSKAVKQLVKHAKNYGRSTPSFGTWKPTFWYELKRKYGIKDLVTGMAPLGAQHRIISGDTSSGLKLDLEQFFNHDIESDKGAKPFYRVEFLGGMRPSPPPYWPKKLVLATMDGLMENIGDLVHEDHPGTTMSPIRGIDDLLTDFYLEPQGVSYDALGINNWEKEMFYYLIRNYASTPDPLTLLFHRSNQEAANMLAAPPFTPGGPAYVPNNNPLSTVAAGISGQIITAHNWVTLHTTAYDEMALLEEDERPTNVDEIKRWIVNALRKAWRDQRTSSERARAPRSVLQVLFEINEIARGKYGYTVSQEDQAFILALLKGTLIELDRRTPQGLFATIPGLQRMFGQPARMRVEQAMALAKEAESADLNESEKAAKILASIMSLIDAAIVEERPIGPNASGLTARKRVHNWLTVTNPDTTRIFTENLNAKTILEKATGFTIRPALPPPVNAPSAQTLLYLNEVDTMMKDHEDKIRKSTDMTAFTRVIGEVLGDPNEYDQIEGVDDYKELKRQLEELVTSCDMKAQIMIDSMQEIAREIPNIQGYTEVGANRARSENFLKVLSDNSPLVRTYGRDTTESNNDALDYMTTKVGAGGGTGTLDNLIQSISNRSMKPNEWAAISRTMNGWNPNQYFRTIYPAGSLIFTRVVNTAAMAPGGAHPPNAVYPGLWDGFQDMHERLGMLCGFYLDVYLPTYQQALGKEKSRYDVSEINDNISKTLKAMYNTMNKVWPKDFKEAYKGDADIQDALTAKKKAEKIGAVAGGVLGGVAAGVLGAVGGAALGEVTPRSVLPAVKDTSEERLKALKELADAVSNLNLP